MPTYWRQWANKSPILSPTALYNTTNHRNYIEKEFSLLPQWSNCLKIHTMIQNNRSDKLRRVAQFKIGDSDGLAYGGRLFQSSVSVRVSVLT